MPLVVSPSWGVCHLSPQTDQRPVLFKLLAAGNPLHYIPSIILLAAVLKSESISESYHYVILLFPIKYLRYHGALLVNGSCSWIPDCDFMSSRLPSTTDVSYPWWTQNSYWLIFYDQASDLVWWYICTYCVLSCLCVLYRTLILIRSSSCNLS